VAWHQDTALPVARRVPRRILHIEYAASVQLGAGLELAVG
jgi:hypothetical protein